MKHLYLALFTLLSSSIASAQSNYYEGYVIKANGDTVKGYINYRDWLVSPLSIDFKDKVSDNFATQYTVQDLKEFTITGMERYITYHGSLTMDANVFPDLLSLPDTTTVSAKVFMKQVYRGNDVSLYVHADNLKRRFFVTESGASPVELIFHHYYSPDRRAAFKKEIYKKQLFAIAARLKRQDDNVTKAINGTNFNEDELLKVVGLLNNDVKVKPSGLAVKFFAGAKASLANRTIKSSYANLYTNSSNTNVYAPGLSLGFDWSNKKKVQKFIFRTELAFSIAPAGLTAYEKQSAKEAKYSSFTTSFIPQLLFNAYNTDNFKGYIGFGASMNWGSYSTSSHNLGNYIIDASFSNRYYGFHTNAGIIVNQHYEIGLSYMLKTSEDLAEANSKLSTLALGAKYRF